MIPLDAPVTFTVGDGEFMCGYVRGGDTSVLEFQDNVLGSRHHRFVADEGITWVRGHFVDTNEALAMFAAGAL